MTREEAIKWLKDIHRRFNPTGENLENEGGDVHLQALDMAIEALQAKTDGDTISRQGAIDEIKALYEWHDTVTEDRAVDHLKRLPSAEPKTGKWVEVEDYNGDVHYQCDQCGNEFVLIDGTPKDNNYWYCPNCGSFNGGDEE